jgi:hypothetical protein
MTPRSSAPKISAAGVMMPVAPSRPMIRPPSPPMRMRRPLVVGERVDLLPEPSAHLRREGGAGSRHEVERAVALLEQLEAVAVVVPGGHASGFIPNGTVVNHSNADSFLRSVK